jgi:hypothetical protein
MEPVNEERAMMLGMSLQTFTLVHTVLSLIGIAAGLIVVLGMLTSNRGEGWTAVFLVTTVLTSVTGFMFPGPFGPTPAQIFGVISLAVLVPAILGLYVFDLAGFWRWVYVGGALLALYLNVFVLVVQAFQKISFLTPLAPTQAELPFFIAQGVVFVLFIALGIIAVKRFKPETAEA